MPTTFLQDPDAELDYLFDWSTWLEDLETISSYVITAETGITASDDTETGGKVTVWLSGGTAGSNYTVACRITTSAGRIDERTITVRVRER